MSSSKLQPVAKYAGLFDLKTVPYNENLLNAGLGSIQPDRLFAIRYQVMPCTITPTMSGHQLFGNGLMTPKLLHATSVMKLLTDEYAVDPNTIISQMVYDSEKKLLYLSNFYVDLGDYLALYLCGGQILSQELENPLDLKADTDDKKFICYNTIMAYCIPQSMDRAQKVLSQLLELNLFVPIETCLLMVCSNPNAGFYTSNITIKQPVIKDLRLNYGDEFPAIHDKLIEQLRKPGSTGITFLHGPPGTGKTYYIRYLINLIKEKNLIYVPPDLVNEITKPGFLPFLMQYPDSILIIEDAENIILDRKEARNPNQAVSNLLNLSDGLLGDAMRLQIITTFNCEIQAIDPALLREGRLIVEHTFGKLSAENARRLGAEISIPDADKITEPMSLAEIYARRKVPQ